jgi:hypothetical protein
MYKIYTNNNINIYNTELSLDKNDPKIIYFLLFCDILLNDFNDGIYLYKSKIINDIIFDFNYKTVEYLCSNYGLLFISNVKYDIFRIIKTNVNRHELYYYKKYEYYNELQTLIKIIKKNIEKQEGGPIF